MCGLEDSQGGVRAIARSLPKRLSQLELGLAYVATQGRSTSLLSMVKVH